MVVEGMAALPPADPCFSHKGKHLHHLASAPFIYLMILPLISLDLFLEMYHRICFPLYGLPYVRRSAYIRIDRHKLRYLTAIERVNCAYCGYANGLLRYASEIAGMTERYWCAIKHREGGGFTPPAHHSDFVPYGDENAYREEKQVRN